MSIKYAILGLLDCGPFTGYDLKKIMQDSDFMHWSGNNNQIYKALVELVEDGFATNEVVHQEGAPSKKAYSITARGADALKRWTMSPPEPPECKKPFLIQLAWADRLTDEELKNLLTDYENELLHQLALLRGKERRERFAPGRTEREKRIWDRIHDNLISSCKQELAWLDRLRADLGLPDETKETGGMNVQVLEKDGTKYLEVTSAGTPIRSERDAVDLIAVCMEHDVYRLLLHADALSVDFFELRNGMAGAVLQKFANYRMKTALLLPEDYVVKGRAKELLAESNRGQAFRTFTDKQEAAGWLVADGGT